MKLLSKNIQALIILALLSVSILSSSCNEEEFLEEIPLDFFSPENSYVSMDNFEAALWNLYAIPRDEMYSPATATGFPTIAWSGTEIAYTHSGLSAKPDWGGAVLLPTNTEVVYDGLWAPCYRMIYDANVIIGRADAETSELTNDEKIMVQAEAAFFRGYAYKMLANLYGGVPIVLEEVTSPKRDFVRATRQEVYEQCVEDFTFAAENLGEIGEVDDGRVNRLAAYHYLAEVYISLGRWQQAITAASTVIDHPGTGLMTERFGTRANEAPHPQFPWVSGGDVYWDLFRKGNQNYSTGNTEAIWVFQAEFNVPGGGGFQLPGYLIPMLWRANIPNNDGSLVPLIPGPNTYYLGRGAGFLRPSYYFFETVWRKSGYDQDIRNSEYNIVRDFKVNNPASDYNGLWVGQDNVPIRMASASDTMRNYFPGIAKAATPGNDPLELYSPDQTVPGTLVRDGRYNFRDWYAIRLAETYLLRAEAHLGNGSAILAAADINVIRNRAQAPEVSAAEVDIDYILDERIRELYYEEFRLLTLTRLGKLVERTRSLNPLVGDTYKDHNDLWPIPFDDIERNTEATLSQNPGY
jgi:hypothetical protein